MKTPPLATTSVPVIFLALVLTLPYAAGELITSPREVTLVANEPQRVVKF